jgi:hypothetical protein
LSFAFANCSNLIDFPDISNWKLKKKINIKGLFYKCISLKNLPSIVKNINLREIFLVDPNQSDLNDESNSCFLLEQDLTENSKISEDFQKYINRFNECKSISSKNSNSTTQLDKNCQNCKDEQKELNNKKTQNEKSSSLINKKTIDSIYDSCKSICKISVSNLIGTGFLIVFQKGNKLINCLMTCEHVINEGIVKLKKEINISYDNEKMNINIKLDDKERFIRNYLYMNIDAIIIEIKKEEISEDFFLHPQTNYENKELINKSVYILQYPEGKELQYSKGNIKAINEYSYEITHLVSTSHGSSGSPIILGNTTEVIGIHKQGKIDKKENYGNFIYPIIESLKNDFIFGKTYYGKEEYEGEFKNGLREGYGKYIYEDGSFYIGEWKNGLKNGKGIIYYKNYTIKYEGNFLNGLFSGYGKYINQDGSYYIGEWLLNKKYKEGTIYYKDNTIKYKGNFREDKFDGYGLYIEENGNYYEGNWENNKKNGKGKYYNKETNEKIIGEFKYDKCINYQLIYEDDYFFGI